MNYILSNTEIVTQMRYEFLKLNRNWDPLDISQFKGKYVIYAIENIFTHKMYIGKCTNLLNRANQYTLIYRKAKNGESMYQPRLITSAIVQEGIQSFKMYPIAVTSDREELSRLERKYVLEYNTMTPNGYNDVLPSGKDRSTAIKPVGTPQTISAKIAKSKLVGCVNLDTKDIIVSIGLKVFGDFVGSSKDQVKNCAKRGSCHRGYYIIYLNNFDRELIKEKMFKKYDNYFDKYDSLPKSYLDLNTKRLTKNFNEYLTAVSYIENLIDDQTTEEFTENGFTCRFLSYPYSSDNNLPYEFYDIDVLFQYLN